MKRIEVVQLAQVGQRDDFTYRLMQDYLRPGMRVLDVGCGNGSLSFLIAGIVGEAGSVTGVDANPEAIAAANEAKEKSGRGNVSFAVKDINELAGERYDAVFGRRVLMYQKDPQVTVETLKELLEDDGIMLFQESDESGSCLNDEHELPAHVQAQDWVWETVRREGGHTRIGGELYGIMKAAGLQVLDYRSAAVLQTAESGSDLAWVVGVMQGRMEALGVDAQVEGLEERLDAEIRGASRAFVRDLAFGICARKE